MKITPFLWFEEKAGEAADFYTSVFKNSEKISVNKLENVPGPEGEVMTAKIRLEDQEFILLNGGPVEGIKFTQAVSFMIDCKDQEEVDYYWENLTADGGEEGPCGWLTDK